MKTEIYADWPAFAAREDKTLNSHDDLLAALQEIDRTTTGSMSLIHIQQIARAAIERAKGAV